MGLISKIKRFLHEYKLYAVKKGPYKFLLQKLESHPSIEMASAIIESGYFRRNLVPLAVELNALEKVIVFAPHQDDEVIGCGGLLSKLSQLGHEIHIVFLTDGDNVEKTMKGFRLEEAESVGKELGAKIHNIDIYNVDFHVNNDHLQHISCVVDEIKPNAIFTIWPLDAPPKHRICNVILDKALELSSHANDALNIYNYQVHTGLIPNVYFDYTELYETKQRLIGLHKSQMKYQNYKHLSSGLDAWNSRLLPWSESERFVELYTLLPKEGFSELIAMYKTNIDETFKSDKVLIQAYHNICNL